MRLLHLFWQKLQVFSAVSYQYQLWAKKGQPIYRFTKYFAWSALGKHRLKSLLKTRSYFAWQGSIFFEAGADSFVLNCFKKSEHHSQTE